MSTIKIKGMRCGHCVGSVTKALEAIEGVSNVKVDLAKGEAVYDESTPVKIVTIKAAIDAIGFEAE
jgi:copper chaperone CopZ